MVIFAFQFVSQKPTFVWRYLPKTHKYRYRLHFGFIKCYLSATAEAIIIGYDAVL